MTRLVPTLALVAACTDPAVLPPPASSPAPATSAAPARAPTNVDARIEFEEGLDPDYGDNTTSVRAFLEVPALGLKKKLFTVPFPYACARAAGGAADGPTGTRADDLVVRCRGDDGFASASLRVEPATLVVVARDYGAIALHRTRDEIPLPRGSTATVFAPARYPTSAR